MIHVQISFDSGARKAQALGIDTPRKTDAGIFGCFFVYKLGISESATKVQLRSIARESRNAGIS
ncbi:hypothetical protein QUB30_14240 [Microcoleus sp. BROC3]